MREEIQAVTGARKPERVKIANDSPVIDDAEETRRGRLLAEVLQLKMDKHTFCFNTTWGDKTHLGLFRTVARIVIDGE